MKRLEDILITRTFSHKEKSEGKIKEIIRTKKIPLTVNTVQPGLRFVHLITDYVILVIFQLLLQILGFNVPNLTALIVFLLAPAYYTLMEFYFQQTPGKMITGSIVIDSYAQKPDFRICLLRTLIRVVPFEAFSCFGTPCRGWHDSWANTYVVKKEYAKELQELLIKHSEAGEQQ